MTDERKFRSRQLEPELRWIPDLLGECDGCGADLFDGLEHDCPVLGTVVVAKKIQ